MCPLRFLAGVVDAAADVSEVIRQATETHCLVAGGVSVVLLGPGFSSRDAKSVLDRPAVDLAHEWCVGRGSTRVISAKIVLKPSNLMVSMQFRNTFRLGDAPPCGHQS